ncbi:hypothetical protein LXT21_29345 [Myxococcus sp. K38C18041901]|uniref:hypothetical protein n=1 Tax=Myxococcus guangdongensis TaxID=2906760 RepID=UPI0020A703EA|nr:hypothetical protein [Myxococcus guangdongensis]MCP3062898.1 hypothetical protein [Myxococcus guangdongensis]
MWKRGWSLATLLVLSACKPDTPPSGPTDAGRTDALRACIVRHVRETTDAADGTFSGYTLVQAYAACTETDAASVEDFETLCTGWVRSPPDQPSRLQFIPGGGDNP